MSKSPVSLVSSSSAPSAAGPDAAPDAAPSAAKTARTEKKALRRSALSALVAEAGVKPSGGFDKTSRAAELVEGLRVGKLVRKNGKEQKLTLAKTASFVCQLLRWGVAVPAEVRSRFPWGAVSGETLSAVAEAEGAEPVAFVIAVGVDPAVLLPRGAAAAAPPAAPPVPPPAVVAPPAEAPAAPEAPAAAEESAPPAETTVARRRSRGVRSAAAGGDPSLDFPLAPASRSSGVGATRLCSPSVSPRSRRKNQRTMTTTADPSSDITALLKARHSLLWVVSREEARVEAAIIEAAARATYKVVFWDCASGLQDVSGTIIDKEMIAVTGSIPPSILDRVRDRDERCVYVLRDLAPHLRDPFAVRALRSLARSLQKVPKEKARAVIVLTPSAEIPLELTGHATVVEWPLPARADIAKILDDVVSALPPELKEAAAAGGVREAAIDAAVGLSAEEATNCYARSLVSTRRIEPSIVAAEKKRVVARGKGVTWEDPDPRGLEAVGGLDNLKEWLVARKAAFGPRARAYGLPTPKGCFLVGLPGTGKTLASRCVAATWGLPLLSLDLGGLQSKYVGESQQNLRQTLALIDAVSPCVVRVDEIEKAMAGASGATGDGGVAADALGTFLTWMQERRSASFVIATANDVRLLPPELLRKGRFDEVFFVDLPTSRERADIVRATLSAYKRSDAPVNAEELASVTEGFSGAEIASLVPDALFVSFADGERELRTSDLMAAAKRLVPLSRTASEKIAGLREWAKGRARLASPPEGSAEVKSAGGAARALDLEA